jgi:hypothetical protein
VVVSFLTGLDASGVTSLFRFVGGGGGGPIGGTTERGDLEEEMNDILWLRTAFSCVTAQKMNDPKRIISLVISPVLEALAERHEPLAVRSQ